MQEKMVPNHQPFPSHPWVQLRDRLALFSRPWMHQGQMQESLQHGGCTPSQLYVSAVFLLIKKLSGILVFIFLHT
jgi:hypothetical protein